MFSSKDTHPTHKKLIEYSDFASNKWTWENFNNREMGARRQIGVAVSEEKEKEEKERKER